LQYVLDSFATVDEAVAELQKDKFRIANPNLPNGKKQQFICQSLIKVGTPLFSSM